MLGHLTRRAFLSIPGALGYIGVLVAGRVRRAGGNDGATPGGLGRLAPLQAPGPPLTVTLEQFVALSERLTGPRPLDRATARVYLDALLGPPGNRELLAEVVHGRQTGTSGSPAHTALEARIVESWYTGVHEVNGAAQVAAYAGALMWNVLRRPAPGSCVGEPGAWSTAPEVTP